MVGKDSQDSSANVAAASVTVRLDYQLSEAGIHAERADDGDVSIAVDHTADQHFSNAHAADTHVANAYVPLWLLAELTYACPLQCPYCSNPLNHTETRRHELTTREWISVLEQGRALGAVQLGLSGGEPCVRRDLEDIVAAARDLGFYSNLLTSTVGLDVARIEALKNAGLDHIQVSFQGIDARMNDFFAGTDCFAHKREMARAIRAAGFPMVLNFVLHRHNIHQVGQMLALALELQAEGVELANCQYHGWASRNFAALLPSRAQLREAEAVVQRFRVEHGEAMPVFFVVPDLYETRPRPCVNGWGSTLLSVAPDGRVLPCQGAHDLPGSVVPNVRSQPLDWIWNESPLFQRFRGEAWMPEPCRSCPEKEKDFGGCRCQAYLLTGDPARTDPVCSRSPDHPQLLRMVEGAARRQQEEEGRVLHMRAPRVRTRDISEL